MATRERNGKNSALNIDQTKNLWRLEMLQHLTRRHVAALLVGAAAGSAIAAAPALAQEPVKIGFGMALTGPLGPNGQQALLGMRIWEDQINKKGGLLGRPVKLIYYDDKSSPAEVPALYTKLLDVDKVDLVVGGYATNQVAPAMPIVIRKGKAFISLFALDINNKFKYPNYFAMIPNGPTPNSFTEGFFQVAAAQKPKPQTVALAAADAEFSLAACDGARVNAKKYGFKVVYDRTYPPATTDFSPIVRAVQATNPDLYVVCSYPLDSVGMVQAVTELGFKPKMFGGAMVGLQATVFKNRLKDKLNGVVNYETWVPTKGMMYEGTEAFFKEYQGRAQAAGVDPLGYYLGGWGHAYVDVLGQAVTAAKSLDDKRIAEVLRKNTFKTVMGDVKFGKNGEWAQPRMLQVQYHSIKPDSGLETWRGMSYQTVVTPSELKTGDVVYPYEKAK
jgi:branched-chain amino acid transport system substrate-binding protein